MKIQALLLAALLPLSAFAQNSASEIGQLFRALETSGCSFNRNGTWYNASQASAHLHRKYDYLVKRGHARTAESFIDQAATKSSVSGQAYLVRCGNAAPVQSKTWFLARLAEIRRNAPQR